MPNPQETEEKLRQRLARECDSEDSIDKAFIKQVFTIEREIGHYIDDSYPWIRLKYQIDVLVEESKKANKS